MNIETRFNLGDTVWSGEGIWQKKYKECPDCLGKKYFNVSTPGGDLFKSRCPVCSEGWQSTGRIREYDFAPLINRLTIGQIRVEVSIKKPPHVEYMAEETGVGSGRCWRSELLFSTRDQALKFAQDECVRKTQEKKDQEEKDRKHKKGEMRPYK